MEDWIADHVGVDRPLANGSAPGRDLNENPSSLHVFGPVDRTAISVDSKTKDDGPAVFRNRFYRPPALAHGLVT